MYDNEIYAAVIPVIQAGLVACGMTGVAVKQAYQPTQQGANKGPTVYLYKLLDRRYGSSQRKDDYVPYDGDFDHIERQYYETTFQVFATSIQSPYDPAQLTAADLLKGASHGLQSDAGLKSLRESGLGILRITDIRSALFMDEKDRHEYAPSFDFTVEHEQVITSKVDAVETVEYNIVRV